jgi:hypothetical protein
MTMLNDLNNAQTNDEEHALEKQWYVERGLDYSHATERDFMAHIEKLEAQLATCVKDRDIWHADASSHLSALCKKQAEVNGLERDLAASQQRYDMLKDETAQCCDARKEAERRAVEMARLVQRERTGIWMDLFEADSLEDARVQARLREDDSYQAAQAVIDQYTTKEQP